MTLYEQWNKSLKELDQRKTENQEYWKDYLNKEKDLYQKILASGTNTLEGTLTELAEQNDYTDSEFVGFIDGINESLNNSYDDLNELEENSTINLDINFEKLLFNMHKAKADWLWQLEEWDDIFPQEEQDRIYKDYKNSRTFRRNGPKIGRNEPCPCGSGKKYKNCCGKRR